MSTARRESQPRREGQIGVEAIVPSLGARITLTPLTISMDVRQPRFAASTVTSCPRRACPSASTRMWFSIPPRTGV